MRREEQVNVYIGAIVMTMFLGLGLWFVAGISTGTFNEPDRSGYTVYLDGQEVSANAVDASLYRHSYDDEKHIIYLSTTQKDNMALGALAGGIVGYWLGK